MKRFGLPIDQRRVANVILRGAFAALLALTLLQQAGGRMCDRTVIGVLTSGTASGSDASWGGHGCGATGTSWAGTEDGLQCDALLPARRGWLVIVPGMPRFSRAADAVRSRFHGNTRPHVQRTKAVFCDYSSLRSILHPHFSVIAHASSVLC
jgi:hypothetical protein